MSLATELKFGIWLILVKI